MTRNKDQPLVLANAVLNLSMQMYQIMLRRFPEMAGEIEANRQLLLRPIPAAPGMPESDRKLFEDSARLAATMYGQILHAFQSSAMKNRPRNKMDVQ